MTKKPTYEELKKWVKELEEDSLKHERTEEILKKRTRDLDKRIKELNCLYAISSLFEERNLSLEEILREAANLIPSATQHPEITCARIILGGKEFSTHNFEETIWKQTSDIIIHGAPGGFLEVCCLEGMSESDEAPFLKEERRLIAAIAELIERIVEQKQTEESLLESEKRFRCLVENSPTGIFIIQDGQLVYENPEEKRLSGPLARLFHQGDFRNIHPDDIEKVKEGYQKIVSGELETLDMDFRFYPLGEEDSNLHMKWVHCRAGLIEYSGKEAILINKLDVTKAKEVEHVLRIEDKMASLGRVTSGIAHEIRNPLSGINIYLNTLEKIYDKVENLDKIKKIIGQIQSASSRIESVIRRVMDFSRPSVPKFVLTDINQPVEDALDLSSVTLRKSGITIEKILAGDLPPCHADIHLMGQVILNLITNASEAMKNMDGAKRIAVTSSMQNNRILVRVSDSGPGVPSNLRRKVFDPFYTTKNGSTGIGLSLSHRIITDHGGSLTVSTSKWGGAEFVIEIPIKEHPVPNTSERSELHDRILHIHS